MYVRVCRGLRGSLSPHLSPLATVPLPALVNSTRVGVGQAGSKNAKGKERSVQRAQKNERRTVKRNFYHSEFTRHKFTEVKASICLVSLQQNWQFSGEAALNLIICVQH